MKEKVEKGVKEILKPSYMKRTPVKETVTMYGV